MPQQATTPRVCEQCDKPLTTKDQERFCSRSCAGIFSRHNLPTRFWVRVDKDGPTPLHRPELGPCWIWTGTIGNVGYGAIYASGRMRGAHCVSWEMANGPIPKDEQVLHDCDNKICVNPAHLHLGTQTQNMHEARDRERFKSKVTADDVRAIRLAKISGATLAELAKIYGIGESAVSHICTRRNWSHID